jgi:alpha-galactosidase
MDEAKLANAKKIVERLVKTPADQRRQEAKRLWGDDAELRAAVMTLWNQSREGKISSTTDSSGQPLQALPVDYIAPNIAGYQIVGRLGQGAMGIVWEAVQLGARRRVALKLLSQASLGSERRRTRFVREVELAASLEHPNIARVYDSGLDKGVYYYAMELVKGPSLDEYVRQKKLNLRQILALMNLVCQAMQYAHERGVVHRDLKPSNILIDKRGQPRILDFGLAKQLENEDGLAMSVDGDVTGTPMYMSPEQAGGNVDKIDARTDVYTIGIIAFGLLTGENPHELTGSYIQVLRRIAEEDVRRPRAVADGIHPDLEVILLKALAHEPAERYPSAGALGDDIRRFLEGEPITARPATFFYVARKKLCKHRWTALAAALVALLLIATVYLAHQRILAEEQRAQLAAEQARQATDAANTAEAQQKAAADKARREADVAAAATQQAQAAERQWQEANDKARQAATRATQAAQQAPTVEQPESNQAEENAVTIPRKTEVIGSVASPLPQHAFWAFAPTPPMGWCSWPSFGSTVSESELLANASYMHDHLLPHGYNIIIVDYRWYNPGNNQRLPTDDFGRFLPAVNRFPSAAGSESFAPLAAKLHGMGLKFGIHLLRGIPRQSANDNTPIEESTFRAADAANTSDRVGPDMYGVNADSDAGHDWYASVVRQFARWKVDFILADSMCKPYAQSDIEDLRSAINATGRPMILDICNGPTPIDEADHVSSNANLWQICPDFWDNWPAVDSLFDSLLQWQGKAGHGHWPDANMIPLGYIGPRSPHKYDNGPSQLHPDEQITLMSLLAIAPSPLILGSNFPRTDDATFKLLANEDVLAVNQDSLGLPGQRIFSGNSTEVWKKPLADGSVAVGFFNRGNSDAAITASWEQLGISGRQEVRNLWARVDLGTPDEQLTARLPSHGAALFRLWPADVHGSIIQPSAALATAAAQPHNSSLAEHNLGDSLTNSLGMKLLYVPPGTFKMGSPDNERGRDKGELQHSVRLTHGFYMGEFDVMVRDFKACVDDSGYDATGDWENPGFVQSENDPVVRVAWEDASFFCEWLGRKENRHYRLPTEAEWEYVCRAGTTTTYYRGNTEADLAGAAWYKLNSLNRTNQVGLKKPNAWGFYDMLGNVSQWCLDYYAPYSPTDQVDPSGPDHSGARVLRGGSFWCPPNMCRCAYRSPVQAFSAFRDAGFRVVMDPDDAADKKK